MAQLAQAYFHFHTSLDAKALAKFGRQVGAASRKAAAQNFDIEVTVDVDIEEGSIKGRITAIGVVLLSTTSLVANYKGVKDSVIEMCQDAKTFGADVCQKAIEYAGVSKKQIYRTERRTKTTGKLGRLLSDIEKLERSLDELSQKQIKAELARFGKELDAVSRDLEPAEQHALNAIIEETKLPTPKKWPERTPEPMRVAVQDRQIEMLSLKNPQRRKRKPLRYHATFKVRPRIEHKDTGDTPKIFSEEEIAIKKPSIHIEITRDE